MMLNKAKAKQALAPVVLALILSLFMVACGDATPTLVIKPAAN